MKQNCDLDLGLQPGSSHISMNEPLNLNQHHHVPILQNGRHCFFDVTEFQARVIIWLASREMEERIGSRGSSSSSSSSLSSISPFPLQSQALMCAAQGLSIKRSLESFLEKRKKRTQSQSDCL